MKPTRWLMKANVVEVSLVKCLFLRYKSVAVSSMLCIIPDALANTFIAIIREKVKADSIVYRDAFKSSNALDVSEFTHYCINHSKRFVQDSNHSNGIENFQNQTKRHLHKFNSAPKEHFHLYLKECEWRFNHRDPKSQLLQLKQWVKQGLHQLRRSAPSSKCYPIAISTNKYLNNNSYHLLFG